MAKVPIAQSVMDLIEPILVAEGLELVDVEYKKEGPNWVLRIFIDKEEGITVADCQKVSHLTGDLIDVEETIKTPFNLEVSSPGLDRSLKREKDFLKFKGKRVCLHSISPIDNRRKFTTQVQDQIEKYGFGYLDARIAAPAIYALRALREQIGLRTALSTVEKIYDLANAPHHIVGVTHLPYIERFAGTIERMPWKRSLLVQGLEGTEDVGTAHRSRIVVVTPQGREEQWLDPASLGLRTVPTSELATRPDPAAHGARPPALLAHFGPLRAAEEGAARQRPAERAPGGGHRPEPGGAAARHEPLAAADERHPADRGPRGHARARGAPVASRAAAADQGG